MPTHCLGEGVHTASTRSPAALVYAVMTLGVIILLVGSLILPGSTSRGSRVTVRMRRRLMSSVYGTMVNPQRTARSRPERTGKSVWGWHQRFDEHRGSVLLHGYSQSGEKNVRSPARRGNRPNSRSRRRIAARNRVVDNHEQGRNFLTLTHARKLASHWCVSCSACSHAFRRIIPL
jgi:hypothetical protein